MAGYQNGLVKVSGLILIPALLFLALYASSQANTPSATLTVVAPVDMDARSTALFLTGKDGWTEKHQLRATRLAEMHTLVIGVDAPSLMDASAGSCVTFAEKLSQIAREAQTKNNAFARTPVLVGLENDSDFAVSAAWAAPDRFKGLVTENATNMYGLCSETLHVSQAKAPLRWLDVAHSGTSVVATLAGATVVEPRAKEHKAFYQSYLRLAGTDSAFNVETDSASILRDLPLTVHRAEDSPASDVYAIFLSGDGGWAKFDEEISDRLAAQGIPVVGVSSLKYMWREKTPTQIASDFERIDDHFRHVFGRSKVMLLGFSLGANTIPFVAQELSDDMRERLVGVGLIAPETHTGFEILVGGWLGQRTGSTEVAPAIQALATTVPAERILCVHGRKESVSACPIAQVPGMRRVEFDGGHHMGNDHDGVARTISELAVTKG
ncbi:hypothetical protein KMP13_07055 [Epibacterium ulvae]|uniref:AcvB/VirJ family lysyl-phosphatidylglycerol hydrolase n=1 Tax=Epibacterium ulvae TaxID=1156985 RepID=UPI001BFC1870|nr:AcvB/VirJ family lysyl-phosphatidylglycerol hydrolase [Epibacterium ulvae]MBT8153657.1 hypothetical protein [Epibacterium ulvae]